MYYIGVEIGGTKQQVCVGTAGGQILERRQVKLGDEEYTILSQSQILAVVE